MRINDFLFYICTTETCFSLSYFLRCYEQTYRANSSHVKTSWRAFVTRLRSGLSPDVRRAEASRVLQEPGALLGGSPGDVFTGTRLHFWWMGLKTSDTCLRTGVILRVVLKRGSVCSPSCSVTVGIWIPEPFSRLPNSVKPERWAVCAEPVCHIPTLAASLASTCRLEIQTPCPISSPVPPQPLQPRRGYILIRPHDSPSKNRAAAYTSIMTRVSHFVFNAAFTQETKLYVRLCFMAVWPSGWVFVVR